MLMYSIQFIANLGVLYRLYSPWQDHIQYKDLNYLISPLEHFVAPVAIHQDYT